MPRRTSGPKLARVALERVYPPHKGAPKRSGWNLDITTWTDDELRHARRVLLDEIARRKEKG